MVFTIVTSVARLPLIEATRLSRQGFRTVIVVESEEFAAQRSNDSGKAHQEIYLSYPDVTSNVSLARRQGPRWALAPVLAHHKLAGTYKWMLLGHDDTIWRPKQALALLASFNSSTPYLVSDHLVDFNGARVVEPSHAATCCLPCHINLTAIVGRPRPPGMPWPECKVCRPSLGCEHRWAACVGIAGGPLCHSKRFLGTGDRCPPSWHSGGAGVALSVSLVSGLRPRRYNACAANHTKAVGERVLSRCMWRSGVAYTLTGLAMQLSKRGFDDRFVAFDPPMARGALLNGSAPQATPHVATASHHRRLTRRLAGDDADGDDGVDSSGGGLDAPLVCDAACVAWARAHAVSVHSRVPLYAGIKEMPLHAQRLAAETRRVLGAG